MEVWRLCVVALCVSALVCAGVSEGSCVGDTECNALAVEERLVEWGEEKGMRFHKGTEIRKWGSEGQRGMFATEALKEGARILDIPFGEWG